MKNDKRINLFRRVSARAGKLYADEFATVHCRNLMAFLAMHPDKEHPRERLVEALWPGKPGGQTRNRLNVTLYHLRKSLDSLDSSFSEAIVSRRATIRLDSSKVRIDLRVFRQSIAAARRATDDAARRRSYARAVSEYTGPLAPEVNEDWSLARQVESSEMFQEAAVWLAGELEERGDPVGARAILSAALDVEPFSERATELLTSWYIRSGQHEMAVSCAKRLRRALAAHGRPPSRSMIERIDELNVVLAERTRAVVFATECVLTVLACEGTPTEALVEATKQHGGTGAADESCAVFHHPLMAMEAGRNLLRVSPNARVFLYTTIMSSDDPPPVPARTGLRALKSQGLFGSESFAALARQRGVEALEETMQGVKVWRLA